MMSLMMLNKKILVFLLVAAIILLVGVFFVVFSNPKTPGVVENKDDIQILSPAPNEAITSPIIITGVVRGNGWTGFEGQVGTVTLLDSNGNILAQTYLPATTEWTSLPTNFETTVTFSATSGTSGKLVFKNENASGDPIRDKTFEVPVVFK